MVLQQFLGGQWSYVLLHVYRVGEMLFILKTLLFAPSPKKLDVYQTQFQAVFKGCNVLFDQLFSLIAAFYNSYQEFLKPEALLARLNEDGQIKLVDYLSNLLTDPTIPIYSEESDFFAALEQEEIELTLKQTFLTFRGAEAALAQRKESGLSAPIDTMLMELHQLKARVQRSETSTSSLLFGSEDVGSGHSLPEIYRKIKERQNSADAVYFDLGVTKFADIRGHLEKYPFRAAYKSDSKNLFEFDHRERVRWGNWVSLI
jgi:hypothetical protein